MERMAKRLLGSLAFPGGSVLVILRVFSIFCGGLVWFARCIRGERKSLRILAGTLRIAVQRCGFEGGTRSKTHDPPFSKSSTRGSDSESGIDFYGT